MGKVKWYQGSGEEEKKLKWITVNDSWKMLKEKCIATAHVWIH